MFNLLLHLFPLHHVLIMPKQPYNPASRGTGKPYTRPQSQEGRPYRSQGASSAPPSRRYDPTAPRPRPQGRSNGPQKVALKSTSLDLSNKALEEPPKDEDLAGLTKLNLTSCQLTSISFVGASAATLTWLNVSGNVLNGCGAWAGVEQLKGLFGSFSFLLAIIPTHLTEFHSQSLTLATAD